MPLPFDLQASLNRLIASYKEKAAGGVSWHEALKLLEEFIEEAMALVARVTSLTGGEKRTAVLAAAGMLIDLLLSGGLIRLGWFNAFLAWLNPTMKLMIKSSILVTLDQYLEKIWSAEYKTAA